MFTAKTPKILQLSEIYNDRIKELDSILWSSAIVYIDWANVLWWQKKLWRHIDPKRMYQFLTSFRNIKDIKRYFGTLIGDKESEQNIGKLTAIGYSMRTKPVKIMHHSIDISSIPNLSSPDILKSFITKWLLYHLNEWSIQIFNQELQKLNNQWVISIEEKKCNFDVEIGVDMMLDAERLPDIDTYILWSWDSDFADIVQYLLSKNKQVYIFCTARRISRELAESKAKIFDLQKIREFICWSKEIKSNLDKSFFL